MIVASLTTHEPRVPFLADTLDSILSQRGVGRVILNAHKSCLPLLQISSEVEIQVVENIGPGKKHLGTSICAPDDIVVTFDDDHIYLPDHALKLVAEVGLGHVAGYRGYNITDWSTVQEGPAHFLDGKTSWAYRAGWLDPKEVLRLGKRDDCWHSDDIYIGALFHLAGYRCWVIPGEMRHVWPTPNIDAYQACGLQFVEQHVREKRNLESRTASWPPGFF